MSKVCLGGGLPTSAEAGARFLSIGILNELKDVERVVVVQINSAASQVFIDLPLLLADRPRLPINALKYDLHHSHLAVGKGPQLHCVLRYPGVCGFGDCGNHRWLQTMNNPLAVRVFLLV